MTPDRHTSEDALVRAHLHLANQAVGELAARTAELEACGRLFGGDVQPNRGCADAAALLSGDDASALRRLKEATPEAGRGGGRGD